jgi:ribosomal protein S18 acetylase RimI-like enzyme
MLIAMQPSISQSAVMENRIIIEQCPDAVPAIAATLALAFQDDPALVWLLPDPAVRRARLPSFFRFMVREEYAAGTVMHSPGMEFAALWRAPGRHKEAPLGAIRQQLLFLGVLRTAILRGDAVGKAMAEHHPEGNHHYLRFVGVLPQVQGKGWGGLGLRAGIERAEMDGLPIYLETATQSNVGLYRRFGFEVTDEWDVPGGGPHFWGMTRL